MHALPPRRGQSGGGRRDDLQVILRKDAIVNGVALTDDKAYCPFGVSNRGGVEGRPWGQGNDNGYGSRSVRE